MNSSDGPTDTRRFQERRNLAVTNANLFIANNNNPFLISPYSPPTNLVRQSQIQDINVTISSVIGDLSTAINLTTWTLKINTIIPGPLNPNVEIEATDIILDATSNVTLDAPTIDLTGATDINIVAPILNLNGTTTTNIDGGTDVNITAPTINIDGSVYFPGNTYFNNISTNIFNASIAGISSLTVSSFVSGDIIVDNLTVRSTLNASTTNTNSLSTNLLFADFGSISTLNASTLTSSDIYTNYLTVYSTLNASTTNTNSVSTNLLFADFGSISTLNASTLTSSEIETKFLTVNNILDANIINASGNITFTTMTGSNISVSTMTVHSTLNVSSIDATGHITFQTMSGNTLSATNYGNFQTMGVHTGTISSFKFSSISMEQNSIATGTGTTFTSSIIILIGSDFYKIPLEKI